MKIGLVIFPFVPSHGSLLQTFAIYTKLKEMGHTVLIINRKRPYVGGKAVIRRTISNFKNRILGVYKGPVFFRGNAPKAIMQNLQPFIDSVFGEDVITVSSFEETRRFVSLNNFDAFVVGSDQVWRPKFVPDIYHYFLDFVPEGEMVKRIAFCPSFGTDEWEYNAEQTEKCKALLSRFDAVAIRESSGVDLCLKYLDKSVSHLLDPTVLLPTSKYADVFQLERYKSKSVVSVFYLDETPDKGQIVNIVCGSLRSNSEYINNRIQDANARIEERIAPSISKWLNSFINSEFVITDSFHATLFALYFNVPFITVVNARRGAARFISVLNELGLQNRLVYSSKDINDDLIREDIDWNKINKYFDNQRIRSIKFLTDSLQ